MRLIDEQYMRHPEFGSPRMCDWLRDKGHKVKASPVKSGPKGYWLHNVVTRKAGDSEYQE